MPRASVHGRILPILAVLLFTLTPPLAARDADGKIVVVASLFPQYDFTRQIGGDAVRVVLLLPPGVESHSYEPTPSDLAGIARADLFVFTGPAMEPWAARLAEAIAKDSSVRIVDASQGIDLLEVEEGDDDGHDHGGMDPHIWLDPVLAGIMAGNISRALQTVDPDRAGQYQAATEKYQADLRRLDHEFAAVAAAAPRRELVFGERFAFAYFFRRYGLTEIGPYHSCAPGSEPGLKSVLEVVRQLKDKHIRYIYRETLAVSRIAKILQEETGADILTVDSLHNPSAKQRADGITYLSGMRQNMAAFAKGLGNNPGAEK